MIYCSSPSSFNIESLFPRARRLSPSFEMKITVRSFHAVSVWRWNTTEDQCAICYQPFDMCCETCNVPGEACPPAWGDCSHHFHMHCITRWLKADNRNCPMCRQPFKLREDIHGQNASIIEPSASADMSEDEWPEVRPLDVGF